MTRKTVFITGAAVRIGADIARDLHAFNMDVIIHYHTSGQAARELTDSLNQLRTDSAFALGADLRDTGEYESLVDKVLSFTGRLDVLINNASSFYPTPVTETTEEQWNDIIDTNLKAPYFLSRACASNLSGNKGCIINMSDIHGLRPLKGYPVYSAAKAGLNMLTQALARELAPDIRVNAVSPGPILWPEGMDEKAKQEIIQRVSLKRQGTTREVSDCIRFLIDNAGYMTGQILNVDGGRTLYS